MSSSLPSPGTVMHGFIVQSVTPLAELNATLVELSHERTGARMVHLATSDHNNLFAVGFRTPPADSTGIAHILEHTTLCGSRRFPVRDPFFAMIRRSLNTFMNALTASDWTFYPFASQNRQDFSNLLSIYLDAAFFPLLRESDFRQEGHRLEFLDPDDPATPLVRRGVVFNEMQGSMASPASLLARRTARALYPTTTYHFNSGGEPAEIPKLSWQALQDFHAAYYHPSNAWFYTYGDLPLEGHLRQIEEEALAHFGARQVDSVVPPEIRMECPQRVSESYPVDPGEPSGNKTFIQMAWLCCDISDSFERLALTLLSSLLLGNPAAPLYKALLDSRLGSNLAPGAGYQDDNRTTAFAVGLQGCEPEHVAAVEKVVLETLERVAQEGFAPERIAGAIHRLEFEHREISGNGYPYPLALLFRIVGPWLHNNDPVSPLRLSENLDRLRREIAAGPFLQNLLRRWLLNNPHRVTLSLVPDPALRQQQEAAAAAELEQFKNAMSATDHAALVAAAQDLRAEQERPQELSLLPTLTRADIPLQEEALVPEVRPALLRFDAPTNGVGYVIGHFSAAGLEPGLRPWLPLWCAVLPQVGAAGLPWTAMAERIEAVTGGISFATEILEDSDSLDRYRLVAEMRGKALTRHQEDLGGILGDLCGAPDFSDLDRLRTLLGQIRTNLENSVVGSGHSYAARAAAAALTPAAHQQEEWGGVTLLRRIRTLAGDPQRLEEFSGILQSISAGVVARERLQLGLTAEGGDLDRCEAAMARLHAGLAAGATSDNFTAAPWSATPVRLGLAFNTPVNFVARVWRGVAYDNPDAAPLTVLARLLRAAYLHREIREKGGAYGGLAGYNAEAGLFSLLSYRDPHIARTLAVYDAAIAWAAAGSFTNTDLDEALLAVFADHDRPLTPGGRGNHEFTALQQGLSVALRQQYREQLLTVGRDDLVRVAQQYLLAGRETSAVAVIGAEQSLAAANIELGAEQLAIERL